MRILFKECEAGPLHSVEVSSIEIISIDDLKMEVDDGTLRISEVEE